MLRLLNERDYDYDRDYDYKYADYHDSKERTYLYELAYFTYYRDSTEYRSPLEEKVITNVDSLEVDYTEADMYAETLKKQIDKEVRAGEYPGLWIHRISIEIVSDEVQRDVDYWTGDTWVNESNSTYESEELELPEDWDANNPDYVYLSDIVYDME